MHGFMRITLSHEALYARFERVGRPQLFDLIMTRFNERFPLKRWHESRRAWQLAPGDLANLIEFCKATFGPSGYVIQQEDTTDSTSRQQLLR